MMNVTLASRLNSSKTGYSMCSHQSFDELSSLEKTFKGSLLFLVLILPCAALGLESTTNKWLRRLLMANVTPGSTAETRQTILQRDALGAGGKLEVPRDAMEAAKEQRRHCQEDGDEGDLSPHTDRVVPHPLDLFVALLGAQGLGRRPEPNPVRTHVVRGRPLPFAVVV
ncbi:hypothetical protein CTA1_9683 [Colletotrichum tanaceti]|uniref:Uncharacterized protein n=1 Tax=Colletotrichum tanaceti TaxID=1306861 RepID=A0A4U6X4D7_9PEZI|nr:hypothetical protein CTA1_9683 [Colletotrichum tanaceti]